jgi:hypothetical protein
MDDFDAERAILMGSVDARLIPHRVEGRSRDKETWKELKKRA